jgi:hypothetical protein
LYTTFASIAHLSRSSVRSSPIRSSFDSPRSDCRSFSNRALDRDRHSAPRPRVCRRRALAHDSHSRAHGSRTLARDSRSANARRRRRIRRKMATMARVVAMAFATLALVAGADASAFVGTDANFDREVMNSGKHVFVKYLAPW